MSGQSDPEVAEADQLLLGRALQVLRGRAGMTQEQTAAHLGADATFVSRIERGKRGVRWPTLMRFLRVYGADLHSLADAADEARRQD